MFQLHKDVDSDSLHCFKIVYVIFHRHTLYFFRLVTPVTIVVFAQVLKTEHTSYISFISAEVFSWFYLIYFNLNFFQSNQPYM